MSYGRMQQAEAALAAEVEGWLAQAAAADGADEAALGDQRGDELPAWVQEKQQRLAKIRAAKAALEAEAVQQAAAERGTTTRRRPPPTPPAKAQRTSPIPTVGS